MRLLVTGSRDYDDFERLIMVLNAAHKNMHFNTLIHGAATGADTLAAEWAHDVGIPVRPFPALWSKYGRRAGPLRNIQMLEEAKPEIVFAFPKGPLEASKGTAHMVRIAREARVKTIVIESTGGLVIHLQDYLIEEMP